MEPIIGSTPTQYFSQQQQQFQNPQNNSSSQSSNSSSQTTTESSVQKVPQTPQQQLLQQQQQSASIIFSSPLQNKVEKLYNVIEQKLLVLSNSVNTPNNDKKDLLDKVLDLQQFAVKIKKEFKNSIHGQVIEESGKICSILKQLAVSKEPNTDQNLVFSIRNTVHLVEIRKKLSILYSGLKYKSMTTPPFSDFISALASLYEETTKTITQNSFSRLQKNLTHEIKTLNRLLSVQWNLAQLQFKETIISLQEIRNGLQAWKSFLQQDQPQGGSIKQIYVGWSYGWLSQFYLLMFAKSNLYFYEILKQKEEECGGDLRSFNSLLSKSEINFVSLIEIFVGKSEVYNFSLIVEADKVTAGRFSKNGYSFELSSGQSLGEEEPLGMRSLYPCLFSYPKQPPYSEHWPNIIAISQQHSKFLGNYKEPLAFFDKKIGTTYFLTKIDQCILMVVIFQKKKDTDNTTKEFLNHVADHLRLYKLLEELQ